MEVTVTFNTLQRNDWMSVQRDTHIPAGKDVSMFRSFSRSKEGNLAHLNCVNRTMFAPQPVFLTELYL